MFSEKIDKAIKTYFVTSLTLIVVFSIYTFPGIFLKETNRSFLNSLGAKNTEIFVGAGGGNYIKSVYEEYLVTLDEESFRKKFAGTPIRRLGHDRFLRNILIAIGNSRDKSLINFTIRKLEHSSSLVRSMAVWALLQLCSDRFKIEKMSCFRRMLRYFNYWFIYLKHPKIKKII